MRESHESAQKSLIEATTQLEEANKRVSELETHARTVNDSVQVENAELKSKIEELRKLTDDRAEIEESSKQKDVQLTQC